MDFEEEVLSLSLLDKEYNNNNDANYYYYRGGDEESSMSFTSNSTGSGSSTALSSARSSTIITTTLSFNDRNKDTSPTVAGPLPHHYSDPHWSAIKTATIQEGGLRLSQLRLVGQLGIGNLGRVFLCSLKGSGAGGGGGGPMLFALKVVDRRGLSPKQACQVETEARVLGTLYHPFLPTLYARINASHYTCLLIDYCSGGDLHSRWSPRKQSLAVARFVASEVLVALEYLHSQGIVYRDLKPENILVREDGHIMLSDFDLCFTSGSDPRLVEEEEDHMPLPGWGCGFFADNVKAPRKLMVVRGDFGWSRSCVGTHEYLAPEVVAGIGHGSPVDWWAFGVLLYELAYGTTPFKGPTKEATLRNIASPQPRPLMPNPPSPQHKMLHDLIHKLLVKDPTQRLTCAARIKCHPFFKGIHWALIRNCKPPPQLLKHKHLS